VKTASVLYQMRIWALRAALVVALVGLWLYATGPLGVSPLVLPRMENVYTSFLALFEGSFIWEATGVTVWAMLVAFVMASVVGLALGFLVSRGPLIARTMEPLFAWGYVFPVALLYPLFLIWFGVGVESKIFFAFVNGVFPIAFNTVRGLRSIDNRYLTVGVAFGASKRQIDRDIKAGAAWPMILSGLRLGAAMVTINVVLAEVLGARAGLGYELQQAANTLQIADSYAVILWLILVTGVLLAAMEWALKPRHP
jgi:ABC-type nitrate/sulfonate/bicarbonate transport system permease component